MICMCVYLYVFVRVYLRICVLYTCIIRDILNKQSQHTIGDILAEGRKKFLFPKVLFLNLFHRFTANVYIIYLNGQTCPSIQGSVQNPTGQNSDNHDPMLSVLYM